MNGSQIIRELLVAFGVKADTSKVVEFDKAIEKTKQRAGQLVKEIGYLSVAVGGYVTGLVVATKQTADQGDKAQMLAAALTTTVEAAQEYEAVFKRVGADANDVADAFGTMADRSEDAQQGTKSFIDDFALLGISVDQLRGKKPEQLFNLLADAVASTEDDSKRLAGIVRILGDDVGRKLAPLLLKGSAGIAEMRRQARATGAILSSEAVAESRRFNDELVRLGQVMTGLRNTLGVALMPVIRGLSEALRGWLQDNRALIRQRIEEWARKVQMRVEQLTVALQIADRVVRERLGGWPAVLGAIASAATAVGVAFGTWRVLRVVTPLVTALGVALGGTTLTGGLLVVGMLSALAGTALTVLAAWAPLVLQVIALAAAIQDVVYWIRGWDSEIGRITRRVEQFGPAGKQLAGLVLDIRDAIRAFIDYYARSGDVVMTQLRDAFYDVRDAGNALLRIVNSLIARLEVLFGFDLPDISRIAAGVLGGVRGNVRAYTAAANENAPSDAALAADATFTSARARGARRSTADAVAASVFKAQSDARAARQSAIDARVTAPITITGATDPETTARLVQRQLREMLDEQARTILAHTSGAR